MLINGFYRILSTTFIDDNTINVEIKLNKDHEVFDGHFPGNPITPGVCMIQAIKEIVEGHLNETLFLKSISNVKFTAIINPFVNANVILELIVIQENSTVRVKGVTRFTDGTIALKYSGTFIKK